MTGSPIQTDERFWLLSEALGSYASDANDPLILEEKPLQASVAVVLRARHPLELLMIKRATSERDPWSGHVALPGGRRDEADGDLVVTARRETREEVGLDLAGHGSPLGRLADVSPSTNKLPAMVISSFVFGVPRDARARVASREIERVFWVPLDVLRDPDNHGSVAIPLPGGTRDFPCYHVGGEHVWGLTYRILRHFLEVFPDSELERLRG